MNVNASILIVEDEVLIAEYIKDTLISMGFSQIALAHSKADGLQAIESIKPDLLLLDIRMEGELDGISIAAIVSKTTRIPFIFITAHSDNDILQKALVTQPEAYLTKPFKKVDVFAAVTLALNNTPGKGGPPKFVFKDGYTTVTLCCEDLLYVESEGNYISVVTSDRTYTLRHSLEWCLQNLPANTFKRIHRSFIVNVEKIKKSNSRSVFIGKKEIPKSRHKSIESNHQL
jgi:DNA-binding LytR/AlgR family response regulator